MVGLLKQSLLLDTTGAYEWWSSVWFLSILQTRFTSSDRGLRIERTLGFHVMILVLISNVVSILLLLLFFIVAARNFRFTETVCFVVLIIFFFHRLFRLIVCFESLI